MIRELILLIAGSGFGAFLLWFIWPMLNLAQLTLPVEITSSQDPNIVQFLAMGNLLFAILGFIVFIVVGWIALSVANRREAF